MRRDLEAVLSEQTQSTGENSGRAAAQCHGERHTLVVESTGRGRGVDDAMDKIRERGEAQAAVIQGKAVAIEAPEFPTEFPRVRSAQVVDGVGKNSRVVSAALRKIADAAEGQA